MAEKVDESKLPKWVLKAIAAVAECYETSGMAGTAYRILETEDGWQLWMHPALTEMVGGPHDGEQLMPGHWTIELSDVLALFKKPHAMVCHFTDDIPEISIEGNLKGGGRLWLHLLDSPPENDEAETTFDVNRGSFGDKPEPEDTSKKDGENETRTD